MENPVELSLVVCAYNEEVNIAPFFDAVIPILKSCTDSYEIVFVNDGSIDSTCEEIERCSAALKSANVVLVSLSRNFGKEAALTAGLDHSIGKAVIPIDVDLQLPPEIIPKMLDLWKEGYMNVIGVRKNRNYEGFVKRKLSNAFYKLINKTSQLKIVPNAGDFRLLDRKVVDTVCKLRESNRFMKGLFSFPGFSATTIEFEVRPRAHGKSKWDFKKLWKFSLDGIFGFSTIPLRIWTYFGFLVCIIAFISAVHQIVKIIVYGVVLPGYASIFSLVLFFGGVQLVSLGVIGEYIGRIYEQGKNRPLYVVDKMIKIHGNNKKVSTVHTQQIN